MVVVVVVAAIVVVVVVVVVVRSADVGWALCFDPLLDVLGVEWLRLFVQSLCASLGALVQVERVAVQLLKDSDDQGRHNAGHDLCLCFV